MFARSDFAETVFDGSAVLGMNPSWRHLRQVASKSGAAFDKAYIDNEVAYHKAVINAVENVLIPDANNADLKSLLQNVLPVLKTHLEHAEMVQKNLK